MSIITSILNELKTSDITIADIFKVIEYLKYYGYLIKEGTFTIQDFFKAIEQFKEFFHILSDAPLDRMTVKAMLSTPRCGHPDILTSRVEEAKWRKKDLKYYVKKNISKLDGQRNNELDTQQIDLAFSYWAEVADLKFTRINTQSGADIVFSIGTGRADGFDGPGSVLAYAYLPNGSDNQLGNVRDDDETWITKPNLRGTLTLNVLCHEIGHNLGLEHSRKQGDLMAAYYSPGIFKPQSGDIERIVNMYGKPTVSTQPTNPNPIPPATTNKICITLRNNDIYGIDGFSIVKL